MGGLSDDWLSNFHCEKPFDTLTIFVNKEWIEDRFNLTDLPHKSPNITLQSIEIIKGNNCSSSEDSELYIKYKEHCTEVYGLIHARYILTPYGLSKMEHRIQSAAYGHCQRLNCNQENLFPIGLDSFANVSTMHLFCPRCNEIYKPSSSRHKKIDGCFFGLNFPQMYFMMHPSKRPQVNEETWKVITPESEHSKKCTCAMLDINRPQLKMLFHRISQNDLTFDPEKHNSLTDWIVGLEGNKIFLRIPENFFSAHLKEVENFLIGMNKSYQSEVMQLLNIFVGKTTLKTPFSFDRNLFYVLMKVYGAFHNLFCVTHEGLVAMKELWQKGVFGLCLRRNCKDTNNLLFPVTVCPEPEHYAVKYYCFSCQNVFHNNLSKSRNLLDGTFYNINLLYKFMIQYPQLLPNVQPDKFTPTLFGFEIHPEVLGIKSTT